MFSFRFNGKGAQDIQCLRSLRTGQRPGLQMRPVQYRAAIRDSVLLRRGLTVICVSRLDLCPTEYQFE